MVFFPTAEEGAARRKAVFGSESKGRAAAIILGSAATLIAAPTAVGIAAGKKLISFGSSLISKIASAPAAQKAVVGAAGTTAAFVLATGEKPSVKTVQTAAAFGINPVAAGIGLISGEVSRQKELFLSPDISTKDKILTAGADIVGLGALVGGGIALKNAIDGDRDKNIDIDKENRNIAKIQANSAKELAEIQAQSDKDLRKQQIELAKIQTERDLRIAEIQAKSFAVMPAQAEIEKPPTKKEKVSPPTPSKRRKKKAVKRKRKKKSLKRKKRKR